MPQIGTAYATERGEAISFAGRLVVMECWKCAITYAVPAEFDRLNHEDRQRSWYCPNGHGTVYSKSRVTQLQDELDRERTARAKERDDMLDRLNKTEHDRRRIRKRIEAGVCPDCNRTFQNLAAHMETKHPSAKPGLVVHKRKFLNVRLERTRCGITATPERSAHRWDAVDCPACLETR